MQQRRGFHKEFSRAPPLPKPEPPSTDPPYEVIEFQSQQYTNTSTIFANKQVGGKTPEKRKCDLCGSSSAQYQCEVCTQQAFCPSCDQMYHRHPKRQNHIRRRIPSATVERERQPPVPPKGEFSLAPIPPPRRNKRATKIGIGLKPPDVLKKNDGIIGSLKRFVGGMNPTSSQFSSRMPPKDPRSTKFPHAAEFTPQSGRNFGYPDWSLENRHRSGSFAALNGPGFSPLIQAQSMAQLNCPSCHHHSMPSWDWHRSQVNLNAIPPAWPPNMSTGTWHGSIMFPPPYTMTDNMSDRPSRRGSIRQQRYNRRQYKCNEDEDSDTDLSVSDSRRSRRRTSPPLRSVSPALSRRSRKNVPSDSEDDTVSRKNDHRFKRRVVSRDPSPAVLRRNLPLRKRYDDEDTMSMKSTSSRKNRKSPLSHKSLPHTFLRKNAQRSSSDSDDELTSERDMNENKNVIPSSVKEQTGKVAQITAKLTETKQSVQKVEQTKNYDKLRIAPKVTKTQQNTVSNTTNQEENDEDWECEHCTYLNTATSRVCDVCCKSRKSKKSVNEDSLTESMKNLHVSSSDGGEKKKGGETKNENTESEKKISVGTTLPPQSNTMSTQTYDIPSVLKKEGSVLSTDEYSDNNLPKISSSAASVASEKQFSPIKQDSPQSADYIGIHLKKPITDELEIVKLLKEAEKHHFSAEDLKVALMQCGDANPLKWLLENWSKMIDTVVTLATNYGHEQTQNIVGTISSPEARIALQMHNGDIWSAATECIRQRQRKYAKLMSKGNFTREDVVTVLTANHGDIEAAYSELCKSQLKPFLMKIWGPPQGLDNECGNTGIYKHQYEKEKGNIRRMGNDIKNKFLPSNQDFSSIQSWLKSIDTNKQDNIDLDEFYFRKQANNIEYPDFESLHSPDSLTTDYSSSQEEQYPPFMDNRFGRYRSCENINSKFASSKSKQFYRSSESLFNLRNKYLNPFSQSKKITSQEDFRKLMLDCVDKDDLKQYIINDNDLINRTNGGNVIGDQQNSSRPNPEQLDLNRRNQAVQYTSSIHIPQVTNNSNIATKRPAEYTSTIHIPQVNNINSPIEKSDSILHPSSNKEDTNNNNRIYHLLDHNSLQVPENGFNLLPDSVKENLQINNVQLEVSEILENGNIKDKNSSDSSLNSLESEESFISIRETSYVESDEIHDDIEVSFLNNSYLFQELKALRLLAKQNLDTFIIGGNDNTTQQDVFKMIIQMPLEEESITEKEITTIEKINLENSEVNAEISTLNNEKISIGDNSNLETHNNIEFTEDVRSIVQNNEENTKNVVRNISSKNIKTHKRTVSNNLINIQMTASLNEKNIKIENVHSEISQNKDINNENIKERGDANNILINKNNNTNKQNLALTSELHKITQVNFNANLKYVNILKFNTFDKKMQATIQDISENNPSEMDSKQATEKKDGMKDFHLQNITTNVEPANKTENILPRDISYNYKKEENNEEPNTNEINFNSEDEDSDDSQEKDESVEEYSSEEEKSNMNAAANVPLPLQNGNQSFSEYTREISTVTNASSSNDEQISEDEVLEEESDEEYLSDNSGSSFKTQVRACLSQGDVTTYDQAVLAVQLMRLQFDRKQSLDAAVECSNIQTAITYLQQDCQLCAEKVSIREIVSMLECEHRCCETCAEQFFTLQISEKSINDCVCPFCRQPDILSMAVDDALYYFSNLDILLKTILKPNIHELFQQKLRDATLMQDPNFKWCIKCSSGFIADPDQKRVSCPDCQSVFCTQCGKLWDKEHDGKTCKPDNTQLFQNDPKASLLQCLEDYGVQCPKCNTKFILVKGGCMHLTCSHCKYEFCSDCLKSFSMGADCKLSSYCAKLGLHAHHPRNCLFYLRDKEPQELKQLLIDNNIQLNLEPAENQRCNVPLQKETDDGLVDTKCGARVEEAGLCRNHLREYLSRLVCRFNLETINLLTSDDLETILIREGKKRPPRCYNTPENEYYKALYQVFPLNQPNDMRIFKHVYLHLRLNVLHLVQPRQVHFIEYLTKLIRKNKIDPVVIFDLNEVLQEFRRRGKSLPIRKINMFEHEYRRLCIKIVQEEIPLE